MPFRVFPTFADILQEPCIYCHSLLNWKNPIDYGHYQDLQLKNNNFLLTEEPYNPSPQDNAFNLSTNKVLQLEPNPKPHSWFDMKCFNCDEFEFFIKFSYNQDQILQFSKIQENCHLPNLSLYVSYEDNKIYVRKQGLNFDFHHPQIELPLFPLNLQNKQETLQKINVLLTFL